MEDVDLQNTVENIQIRLREKLCANPVYCIKRLSLICGGRTWHSEIYLHDLNVIDETTVHVITKNYEHHIPITYEGEVVCMAEQNLSN